MNLAANITLGWSRSVSADAKQVDVTVSVDGQLLTSATFPPEVESLKIQVGARKSVHAEWVVTDTEGNKSIPTTFDFVVGDLEAPQPVTDPFFKIDSVVDLDAPPPTTSPPTTPA